MVQQASRILFFSEGKDWLVVLDREAARRQRYLFDLIFYFLCIHPWASSLVFSFSTNTFGCVEAKVTLSIEQWIAYWMIKDRKSIICGNFPPNYVTAVGTGREPRASHANFFFRDGKKKQDFLKKKIFCKEMVLTSLDVCLTERHRLGFVSLRGVSVACWTGLRSATTTLMSSSRRTEWVTAVDFWMTPWESISSNLKIGHWPLFLLFFFLGS